MSKGRLAIHSENILPIIKQWLYSDRDIFVRELVSNACDAIRKQKLVGKNSDASPFRIDIRIDKNKKTLTFSDNGIGMTKEEIEKYIAQIAFSGAEDFVQIYEKKNEQEAFIGHFGLGFYSAYMVAHTVEIDSLSHREGATPAHWRCDGSAEYDLGEGERDQRGTTITLHIQQEGEEFLEEARLKHILQKYCSYLPFPIYLNDQHINTTEPLWVKPATECTAEEYRSFFRHLYPAEPDPLFWVHLHVDYPFHLQGILFFPKIAKNIDLKQSTIQLYCNRVFVADNCKDIIPQYLTVLKGAIDSPDIPLNVSRRALQMDRTVRQLSSHVAKKVADSLTTLYRNEKERFFACWEDISPLIKLGAIEDPKFYERVKDLLFWKDNHGNWVTAEQYLEKNKDKTKQTLFYTQAHHLHTPLLSMYQEKGIDVLISSSPIDSYLIQSLEGKLSPARFQRIDATMDESLIDKEREQTILDTDGKTQATRLAESIRSLLGLENMEIEAKSLSSEALPGFLMIDESQRRMREYFQTMHPEEMDKMGAFTKSTFVINTNSPLIATLPTLQKKNPSLAKDVAQEIYDLARLSQKEMDSKGIQAFVERTQQILITLTQSLEKEE